MSQTLKNKNLLGRWFFLCPVRHLLTLLSLALIAASVVLRPNKAVMAWMSSRLVRPWHRFFGKLCDPLPFSMAAILIAALVLCSLGYLVFCIIGIIRHGGAAAGLYRLLLTAAAIVSGVYALFCLLWGAYYYSADFEEQSGIRSGPVSASELETVTRYFAGLANAAGEKVARDENGLFGENLGDLFARSDSLYSAVEEKVPCLAGEPLHAKAFLFSKAMSLMDFSGFFFPFTGEANVNVDCPACLIPATIAHELAHQRGVAEEDEANFAAVLACMESGDNAYIYSASLLAYIHLGNALHKADYDAWQEVYTSLSSGVRADLDANNAYWQRYTTPVSKVTDTVYTGFLQSYGQSLGLQTYGACVDLLVAYYDGAAQLES